MEMSQTNTLGNRSHAVRGQRHESPDSLDLFCTPPWATRAFTHECLVKDLGAKPTDTVWEPASGLGHMSEPLRDYFNHVWSTDVYDYGYQDDVPKPFVTKTEIIGDSLSHPVWSKPDWIITNPPFNLAENFVLRSLNVARRGVAMLVRPTFAESIGRYRRLYAIAKPYIVYQYVERVPMVKGRWDPNISSATSYQWFVWRSVPTNEKHSYFDWIPPGMCKRYTRPDDVKRFADRQASVMYVSKGLDETICGSHK